MDLTQESVLSLLIAEGGKVKKSDLVAQFKASVDCDDPAEKQRNRELFKTFVNNVAFVKEIDGVRFVVARKVYQHLVDGVQSEDKTGDTETGEQQRPPVLTGSSGGGDDPGGERSAGSDPGGERSAGSDPGAERSAGSDPGGERSAGSDPGAERSAGSDPGGERSAGSDPGGERSAGSEPGGQRSAGSDPDQDQINSESSENPSELLSPIQLALQRSKYKSSSVKRMLNFDVQNTSRSEPTCKPYGLPVRMPPSVTRVEICKLKEDPPESPGSFRNKRRPPSVETSSSPQLRRSVKSTKASEEPKETRSPSSVPLEQSEHEWLVKCAAGHWSQVYGLLLRDHQLAEKRDFMSGFTALHWAAKCGNSEMLLKIIDVSRQGGVDIDINAKTHGGYTPLHIAALHDQEYITAMLVGEHGADPSLRDNCGKRAYHYLHKGVSGTVREMLGEPKAREVQDRVQHEKEEPDLFPDLSKGLHSISRLFQPHVVGKGKKHKQRSGFYSLTDDPVEEREDGSFRQRVVSDVFM